MMTEQETQRRLLANSVVPQTLNGTGNRKFTGSIDMTLAMRAYFRAIVGAVTGGASISCFLQESADNVTWTANETAGAFGNSGGLNVSQAGIVNSNTEYSFEVRADQLTSGMRYVRLEIVEINGVNAVCAATAEGVCLKHRPDLTANDGTQISTKNVVA